MDIPPEEEAELRREATELALSPGDVDSIVGSLWRQELRDRERVGKWPRIETDPQILAEQGDYDQSARLAGFHVAESVFVTAYNEFIAMATGKDGRIDPVGYLALRKMYESIAERDAEAEEKGRDYPTFIESFANDVGDGRHYRTIIAVVEGEAAISDTERDGGQNERRTLVVSPGCRFREEEMQSHVWPSTTEGYTREDLPYLYAKLASAERAKAEILSRNEALQMAIHSIEVYGDLSPAEDRAALRGRPLLPPGAEISPRGFEYFTAVLSLEDQEFETGSQYFGAVADEASGEGRAVSQNAPWMWMRDNGFVGTGESVETFKPRLEAVARELLGLKS